MNHTNYRRQLGLTLAAAAMLLAGCASVSPSTQDTSLQEAVLRQHLAGSQQTTLLLVAFGRDPSGKYIDPPPEFFQRIADLHRPIKPASVGDYGETLRGNRLTGYRSRATGRRAWLLSIEVKGGVSPTKRKVVVTSTGGALSGGERTFTATRDAQGRWRLGQVEGATFF